MINYIFLTVRPIDSTIHVMGMAGYSKLINGLLAVASGALYTEVRAYCLHVNI